MVGAPGLGHGGRAARRGPGDRDRPGGRPAGRADGAVAGRPRRRGRAGRRADAPATVLRELVASGADDGFLGTLHARGLRPHDAMALRLFGHDGAPGASQAFACERDALLVVAAPGGRLVDGDPPASALVVEVKRDTPRSEADAELPAPLAEPRLDFRVDRASALVLRGARGRVHPGDRRARAPVLGLPRLPQAEARERPRARHGRRDHAHADGRRLPAARPLRQVLRRGHGPARAGGARHGRPPRHVRARLHAPLLRGHGLPGPRELHARTSTARSRRTGSRRAPAGRPSTSSSTRAWTTTT